MTKEAHSGTGPPRSLGRPAAVTRIQGGGTRSVYPNKVAVDRNAGGKVTYVSDPSRGVDAKIDPRTGRATQISIVRPGSRTIVQRGPLNDRRIEMTRTVPGGVERVVHYGNWSSVQRPISGRPHYVQRTIFVGGRSYAAVYHSYSYHGVTLFSPVPAVVFAPAYYGWLINPWRQPVIYTWDWTGQPWYDYYAASFAPYPAYASADQWLTDYVIAASLQQAYDDQQSQDGGPVASTVTSAPQITAEEKAIVNQDVKDELAQEQQFALNPTKVDPPQETAQDQKKEDLTPETTTVVPEALKAHQFFVHPAPLEVQQTSGKTCSLTEGDMLYRKGDALAADNTVEVEVKHSRGGASHTELCAPQARVRVQLSDLQEMYNYRRDLMAEGEKQASTVGQKHGLPKGPNLKPTQLARGKADPDAGVGEDLKQLLRDADETERDVSATATAGS